MQETQYYDGPDALPPQATNRTVSANFGPAFPGARASANLPAGSSGQLATPAPNPRYDMQYKSRGVAVIINNMKFDPLLGLDERSGTDMDAANLHRCFGHLGFTNIMFYKNLKCDDIRRRLREVASMNHRDHAMFVCAILSHGELGKIYGTDGLMPLQDVIDIVKMGNNQGLAGKPKLFIIQACRGNRLDGGTIVTDAMDPRAITASSSCSIPVEQDCLMAYSSTPGFYSWRNSKDGTFFIRCLTEELRLRSSSSELMTILTRVNRRVAYDFKSNTLDESTRGKKQVPCITSMLTKELYFTKA